MNKLSPVIQSINPVQQSSPQSSPVIRYDPENGKNMFEQLEKLVRIYNDEMKKQVEEQSENAEKKKNLISLLCLRYVLPLWLMLTN